MHYQCSISRVSLVFAVLALIGHVVLIPFVTLYGFWVAIIAYVILAVGVVMENLAVPTTSVENRHFFANDGALGGLQHCTAAG